MDKLAVFNEHRALLFAIAYRMLSSVSDAEDVLQEAWIRWQSNETVVRSPKAFLSSMTTRLCIDHLRSAVVKRERYFGTWLPEPIVSHSSVAARDYAELSESLSFAFLTLLECLSPIERAVYLLREVFDYDYPQIADTVGKSVANCRQIVCRARQHLKLRKPSASPSIQQKEGLIEAFLLCWNRGDVQGLMSLMDEEIVFCSDGGGQTHSVQAPLLGYQKVARFLVAIRRSRLIPSFRSKLVYINEQPGILNTISDQAQSTFSFEFSPQCIQSIFAVVNPNKLTSIPSSLGE